MSILSEIKFTRSDIRGAIVICVVLIAIVTIVSLTRRHRAQEVAEALNEEHTTQAYDSATTTIKEFDPNTVELRELLSFGLTKYEALSIIRYRASGHIFNIKEELIACYGISDSLYFALEPYIVIAEEYRYKQKESRRTTSSQSNANKPHKIKDTTPRLTPSPFLIDTVGAHYLTAIGALTQRQAEVFVKWRDMSGIESLEDLRGCYTVSDSVANWLAQYAIFTPKAKVASIKSESTPKFPIELNTADSAALDTVYGIGAKTAMAIIDYRERLGGFHSKEQLAEIKIITESNFERIIEQIYVNNSDISKIDINFATAKELSNHPYFTNLQIRRLLKIRELKGGWRTLEEMIVDNIFTFEEAQRVRPYLHFEVLNPL